jgi:long-chain acyl-CoA synthetase
MEAHWLIERLREQGQTPGLVWQDVTWSYADLLDAVLSAAERLDSEDVTPGTVLAIRGDYSPGVVALLLAGVVNRNIMVPIASAAAARQARMLEVAQANLLATFDEDDNWNIVSCGHNLDQPLLRQLADTNDAGLILFSSGSTGESKASVLSLDRLLDKFRTKRTGFRTLVFLLLDHIGGINTLFHTLCNGGTIVTAAQRDPEAVAAAIAAHRVQLLPTTPTFLNMLLISEAPSRHDLSSLEIITYGTEPMPQATLAAVAAALPSVRMKQTYGLSELGILPTKSRDSKSVWLKLGADGFEHKIVDGILWIRSSSAMLGYLNAPAPFDAEGWFNTQDLVETDGEYVRILGRRSELINVGGEKVHPTEIENVLLQLENVRDVTVSGRPNPVVGTVVAVRITPVHEENPEKFKGRIRRFCRERLEPFKIPAVIEITGGDHHGARFKKSRGPTG